MWLRSMGSIIQETVEYNLLLSRAGPGRKGKFPGQPPPPSVKHVMPVYKELGVPLFLELNFPPSYTTDVRL